MYDITDSTSFNNVKVWLSEIDRYAKADVSRFLVGNKCDLEAQRSVTREAGSSFAASLGVPFLETSAKSSQNVQQLFTDMTKEIMSRQKPGAVASNDTVDVSAQSTRKVHRRRC